MKKPPIRPLRTRSELIELARELGVRRDWHEPDEQGITARVEGTPLNFDNAMGAGHWYGDWRPGEQPQAELHVVLSRRELENGKAQRGEDIATINLADLFAWASEEREVVNANALRAEHARLRQEMSDLKAKLRRLGGAA